MRAIFIPELPSHDLLCSGRLSPTAAVRLLFCRDILFKFLRIHFLSPLSSKRFQTRLDNRATSTSTSTTVNSRWQQAAMMTSRVCALHPPSCSSWPAASVRHQYFLVAKWYNVISFRKDVNFPTARPRAIARLSTLYVAHPLLHSFAYFDHEWIHGHHVIPKKISAPVSTYLPMLAKNPAGTASTLSANDLMFLAVTSVQAYLLALHVQVAASFSARLSYPSFC